MDKETCIAFLQSESSSRGLSFRRFVNDDNDDEIAIGDRKTGQRDCNLVHRVEKDSEHWPDREGFMFAGYSHHMPYGGAPVAFLSFDQAATSQIPGWVAEEHNSFDIPGVRLKTYREQGPVHRPYAVGE